MQTNAEVAHERWPDDETTVLLSGVEAHTRHAFLQGCRYAERERVIHTSQELDELPEKSVVIAGNEEVFKKWSRDRWVSTDHEGYAQNADILRETPLILIWRAEDPETTEEH
ncbi:hypothetical protein [Nesterenkonia rhizosphaerae]|uniref:Uncharacterized protein n=1 Tax=Nesterenkonia rhizosphaerae TaxID=1348272 RepID=A0ABP9FZU1_9MICC